MLTLAGTCCVQFETNQTFGQQVPTFLLFCDGRGVARDNVEWNPNNVGLMKTSAHAPCNRFLITNNRSAFSSFWTVIKMAYQSELSE